MRCATSVAERGGIAGRALERVADPVRSVRQPHEGREPERVPERLGMGADRRVAGRAERRHERALRGQGGEGRRIGQGAGRGGDGLVARTRLEREAALTGRRNHVRRAARRSPRGRAARVRRRRARSRRRRPPRAGADGCPRSRAARGCAGRAAGRAARRGGGRSPCPRRRPPPARRARTRRRARRAGRRARAPRRWRGPSGRSPGTSFAEWTARSMSPARSASSISLTKRALSEVSGAPARRSSPEVRIGTSSTSPSRRSATQPAWARASALPRVPSRIVTARGCGGRRRAA